MSLTQGERGVTNTNRKKAQEVFIMKNNFMNTNVKKFIKSSDMREPSNSDISSRIGGKLYMFKSEAKALDSDMPETLKLVRQAKWKSIQIADEYSDAVGGVSKRYNDEIIGAKSRLLSMKYASKLKEVNTRLLELAIAKKCEIEHKLTEARNPVTDNVYAALSARDAVEAFNSLDIVGRQRILKELEQSKTPQDQQDLTNILAVPGWRSPIKEAQKQEIYERLNRRDHPQDAQLLETFNGELAESEKAYRAALSHVVVSSNLTRLANWDNQEYINSDPNRTVMMTQLPTIETAEKAVSTYNESELYRNDLELDRTA